MAELPGTPLGAAPERILVTGGDGFVGRNIIDHLSAQGDVLVFTGTRRGDHIPPSPEGAAADIATGVTRILFDVCDREAMAATLEAVKPTHIINCAGYGISPKDQCAATALAVNVHGALDMLQLAKRYGVKRFVQLGTCSEYGPKEGCIHEDAPLNPVGDYAVTKAAGSLLLIEAARGAKVELLVARLFGVWGPYEPAHRLLPSIMTGIGEDRPIELSEGTQVRDFSFAPDVATALVELTLKADFLSHDIVNIGSGNGVSVRDFASQAAKALEAEHLLRFGVLPMRRHEVRSHIANVARLREILGWTPSTTIAAGVRMMQQTA